MRTRRLNRRSWIRLETAVIVLLVALASVLVITRLSMVQSERRYNLLLTFQRFETEFLQTELYLGELLSQPGLLDTFQKLESAAHRAGVRLNAVLNHTVLKQAIAGYPEYENVVEGLRSMWNVFIEGHIASLHDQVRVIAADPALARESGITDLLSRYSTSLYRGDFSAWDYQVINYVERATDFVPRFVTQVDRLEGFLTDDIASYIRRVNMTTLLGIFLILLAAGAITFVIVRETARMTRNLEREVENRTRELVRAQSEIQYSRHIASMGRLAVGLAHHLNTPLGSIITTASYMRSMLDDASSGDHGEQIANSPIITSLRSANDIVLTSGQRSAEVIESFRAIRTGPQEEPEAKIDVSELLTQIEYQMEDRFRAARARFDVEGVEGLVVTARRSALTQVLTHLIENALVHGLAHRQDGTVAVSGEFSDDHVRMIISDDGAGLPPERVAAPFDPYVDLATSGHPGGVGLFVVHSLVTQVLGGDIAHLPDKPGTVFQLQLPLRSPEEQISRT
jgi:signal transduction histidine kinase